MVEGYVGPKYDSVRVSNPGISTQDRLSAQDLVKWARIFHELGLAPPYEGGSYGNIGFRTANGLCLTPSRRSLSDITAEEITKVINVSQVPGKKPTIYFCANCDGLEPTSEAEAYWELFKASPDVNAILHGHDQYVLRQADHLSRAHRFIGVTTEFAEYGTPEFTQQLVRALNEGVNYIIAREHGFFSLGKTFDEAGILALKMHVEAIKLESIPN